VIVEFEVLARLPSWNAMYSGVHHTERTRIKKLWWALVREALPADVEMFKEQVDITIHAYYKGHPCDSDNLMAKLIIDAIKGKVIADDGPACVRDVILRSTPYKEDAVWTEVRSVGHE